MVDSTGVVETCQYVGFCALKTADQAAWAGAIGSLIAGAGAFFAAWVALRVAGVERTARKRDRADNALVAGSFIYADMSLLATFGCELHRVTLDLAKVPPGQAFANQVLAIQQTAVPMKQIAERAALEMLAALPAPVAANLARAVWAIPFPCDMIVSTVDAIGMMLTTLDAAQQHLANHAEGLRVPLRRLVSYFEWYGKQMPESDLAVKTIIQDIYSEVGRPLSDGASTGEAT